MVTGLAAVLDDDWPELDAVCCVEADAVCAAVADAVVEVEVPWCVPAVTANSPMNIVTLPQATQRRMRLMRRRRAATFGEVGVAFVDMRPGSAPALRPA